MSQKSSKKRIIGEVTNNSADKTVRVRSAVVKRHPKYRKRYTVHQQYLVHDEKNEYQVGDVVEIGETRPLSKRKKWRVVRKIK